MIDLQVYVMVAWITNGVYSSHFVIGVFTDREGSIQAYHQWVSGGGYDQFGDDFILDNCKTGYEVWDRTLNEVEYKL